MGRDRWIDRLLTFPRPPRPGGVVPPGAGGRTGPGLALGRGFGCGRARLGGARGRRLGRPRRARRAAALRAGGTHTTPICALQNGGCCVQPAQPNNARPTPPCSKGPPPVARPPPMPTVPRRRPAAACAVHVRYTCGTCAVHVRYMCGTCAGPRCRQTLHGQGAARRAGARAGRAPAWARRAETGARLDEPSVTPRARGGAAVDRAALAPPRARAGWRRERCAACWLAPAVERRSACLTPWTGARGQGGQHFGSLQNAKQKPSHKLLSQESAQKTCDLFSCLGVFCF
jgi:hypothetical protein